MSIMAASTHNLDAKVEVVRNKNADSSGVRIKSECSQHRHDLSEFRESFGKRIRNMAKEFGYEDIMVLPTGSARPETETRNWPKQRCWMYLFGLFLFDSIALYASFWLTQGPNDIFVSGLNRWLWYIWPALYAFLVLPFFFSNNLYNYHLIFFFRKHS